MSQKEPSKPVWYKNTYFWISGILFVIGVIGLIAGQRAIRDPGQQPDDHLAWFYMLGSVVMLVNGLLSHWQTVKHYQEVTEEGVS